MSKTLKTLRAVAAGSLFAALLGMTTASQACDDFGYYAPPVPTYSHHRDCDYGGYGSHYAPPRPSYYGAYGPSVYRSSYRGRPAYYGR